MKRRRRKSDKGKRDAMENKHGFRNWEAGIQAGMCVRWEPRSSKVMRK